MSFRTSHSASRFGTGAQGTKMLWHIMRDIWSPSWPKIQMTIKECLLDLHVVPSEWFWPPVQVVFFVFFFCSYSCKKVKQTRNAAKKNQFYCKRNFQNSGIVIELKHFSEFLVLKQFWSKSKSLPWIPRNNLHKIILVASFSWP